jgi:4-hydroxybenzoate polyprenyltransferase
MTQSLGVIDYLNITANRLINSSYEKIESLISFLLASSLFLSIGGFLKTYYSFLLFGSLINWNLLLATFLVVFAVYCMNKLTDKEEDAINSPERVSFISGKEKILGFAVAFSYFTAIILGILESVFAMLIILFPLFAGIIYSIKISPKIPRLKDVFAVKNIITALSWAVITTFLPLINLSEISLIFIISIFYFFFVKSFVNTVIFDVKDIDGDRKNNIITIPVRIGKLKTKKLLSIFTLSLIPAVSLLLIYGLSFSIFITMIFGVISSYWYIHYVCNSSKINGQIMQLVVHGEWLFVLSLCFIVKMF